MRAILENSETATQKTFKSYIFFWSGQLFSLLGSSVTQFVIVWWITITTKSVVMLSIASFLYMVPMTIVIPIAGVIIDRYNRKRIIIIVDSLQAIITLFIIILFNMEIADPIMVILLNGVLGLFQGFHMPTVSAIVPTMVPKENLSRINGVNYLFTGFIRILGPLVAATLIAFMPIKTILWIDPMTFIIAFIPLILIKIPKIKTANTRDKKNSFSKEFKEGFQMLKLIPVVSMMLLTSMFLNFLTMPFHILRPYFVRFIHSGTALDLAFISAFFYGGMLLGALTTSIKKNWKHKIFIYFSGNIGLMLSLVFFAFSPKGWFLLLGIAAAFYGVIIPFLNTIYLTMMQIQVPLEKMGRLSSIDLTISMALSPIAALSAGFLAEIIGVRNLFLYSAIIGMVITIIIWRFTSVRYNGKSIKEVVVIEIDESEKKS